MDTIDDPIVAHHYDEGDACNSSFSSTSADDDTPPSVCPQSIIKQIPTRVLPCQIPPRPPFALPRDSFYSKLQLNDKMRQTISMKLLTLNVKGLCTEGDIRTLLEWLKQSRTHIYFLQEL